MSPVGLIDSSDRARALYSSDASLYRVLPQGVALPRSTAELTELLAELRRDARPVTMRGAGTSCSGNAIGPGVIVDTSAHLNRLLNLDTDSGTALVEPGIVHAVLQRQATRSGWLLGPDPSTHTRCTIGGMLGNNACGPRALGYGRTSDVITGLDVVTGTGEELRLGGEGATPLSGSSTLTALHRLVADNLGIIRTEFGRFSRQVSGYSLEHLLPENGFNLARFLVGSEGTLAVVTRAEISLSRRPRHTLLVVLGYRGMAEAADDILAVLAHRPVAVEGLDRRIVAVVERAGSTVITGLPPGEGWTMVELAGDDRADLHEQAVSLLASAGGEGVLVDDPAQAAALWRVRSDGAGLAAVSLDAPAHAGWEDAAVPAEALGAYLRDFEELLAQHRLHALPYGHFGEGCVHARIDFPLTAPDGRSRFRSFLLEAADLVASHGGSMSGEHGDGRARSELLARMYSPQAMNLFAAVKQLFDPLNLLNPGVLVDPAPLDENLRLAGLRDSPLAARFPAVNLSAHRCTGVGRCLERHSPTASVMCPSYRATGQEQDSTRGRARILQELMRGEVIADPSSPDVLDVLDRCLSCKGCASDCPTGTDIAAAKSIILDAAWRGRLRPRSHYALGRLPALAPMVSSIPGSARVISLLLEAGLTGRALRWLAGIEPGRRLPRFASSPAHRRISLPEGGGRPVALWLDTFTDHLDDAQLEPLLQVLAAAGWAPQLVPPGACCGLTWITTGQRPQAAARIRHALDLLHPIAARKIPILGVEPSCLAVWRSDAADLVDDPRVAEVAAATRTLAELLAESPTWEPPCRQTMTVIAQPHCHHAAVLGWQTDETLLRRTGAELIVVGGCCGLAGNFGLERGHGELSRAVAADQLLPALREYPDAVVLADGISCRTQVLDLDGRRPLSLASFLAEGSRR